MQGVILGILRLNHLLRGAPAPETEVPPGEDRAKAVSTKLGDVPALSATSRVRASGLIECTSCAATLCLYGPGISTAALVVLRLERPGCVL